MQQIKLRLRVGVPVCESTCTPDDDEFASYNMCLDGVILMVFDNTQRKIVLRNTHTGSLA